MMIPPNDHASPMEKATVDGSRASKNSGSGSPYHATMQPMLCDNRACD